MNEDESYESAEKNKKIGIWFKFMCVLHTCEGVVLVGLVGAVEEREFELVPSDPIAESVVVG